jgi:hypothetical protein
MLFVPSTSEFLCWWEWCIHRSAHIQFCKFINSHIYIEAQNQFLWRKVWMRNRRQKLMTPSVTITACYSLIWHTATQHCATYCYYWAIIELYSATIIVLLFGSGQLLSTIALLLCYFVRRCSALIVNHPLCYYGAQFCCNWAIIGQHCTFSVLLLVYYCATLRY